MKKIKFLIASMLGAIALVFACVFGSVNVNAEHDYTANYSWRMPSTNTASNSGTFKFGKTSFGSVGTLDSNNVVDGETFNNYGMSNSNTRTCTISLSNDEWTYYDVAVYVYYYATSNRTLKIGNGTATTVTQNKVTLQSGNIDKTHNTIVQSGNMGWCGIDIVLTLKISTPVLEQQENASGSAIRYIATVEGVTSESLIQSWTVTMSINIEGKSDYVVIFTDLYTAVGGTNGKSAADDTVYLVATWKNIPSSLNGKKVSTNFKITLNDSSSTVLTSNTVEFTINVQ